MKATALTACPPQEDLLDLLEAPSPLFGEEPARGAGGEGPSALRAHVAACPQCTAHLAEVAEGYAALSPLAAQEAALDPALLRRMEDAVLSAMVPRWNRRLLVLGLLCVAWTGLVLLLCTKVLGQPIQGSLPLTVALTLLPAGLVPALWSSPAARRRALQLGVAATALGVLATVRSAAVPAHIDLANFNCSLLALLTAALPAVVLFTLAGRAAPGQGAVAGALLGSAAFASGLAVQSAMCPGSDLAHLLGAHFGPFLLGVLLLALLGRLRQTAAA